MEKAGVRRGQRTLGLFPKDQLKKCCPFPRCQGTEPPAGGDGEGRSRDAQAVRTDGVFQKLLRWPCSLHMTGPGTSNFMTAFIYIYILYVYFIDNFHLGLLPALPDGAATPGLGLEVQTQCSAAILLQYFRPMWLACSLIILGSLH